MHEKLRSLNTETQEAMDGSLSVARDAVGSINVKFQCGPVPEVGVNGTSIENVITLLIQRLEGFQSGPFSCDENRHALWHLRGAVDCLEARTTRRVAAGTEGTMREGVGSMGEPAP